MKRLSIALFISVFVAAGLTPAAQAVTRKTLVLIDSGIAADLVREAHKGQGYQTFMNYVWSNPNNVYRTVTEFYSLKFMIKQ